MPKTNDMREKLKALKLFGEFTDTERDEFLELAECAQFKAGEHIVRQDERGDCMYVILDGTAKVIHHRQERRTELATLGAGEFFGELALVDEGPRSADVVAVSDCTLLRIPKSVVHALAGVYPGAAFKLLIAVGRVLVRRLRQGNQKYIDSLLAAAAGGR
jgi:CRP-like cAMP-binding protein